MRRGRADGALWPWAVGLVLATATSGAPEEPARVLSDRPPLWDHAPGFAEVAAAYPKAGDGVTGDVWLRCRTTREGALQPCAVASETPSRHGFAAAALSLTPFFHAASPPGVQPITIPVHVRLPPPDSPEMRERQVSDPSWIAAPDGPTVLALYPAAARAKGIAEGLGAVRCRVKADGWLADCIPVSADPAGAGFGEAAVRLAPMLRMTLWTRAGGPIDGSIVVPIRFKLAGDATALPPDQIPTLSDKTVFIDSPRWVRRPTGPDFIGADPERAERSGINGDVLLSCGVLPSGRLTGCQVVRETPPGWGFGQGALRLSAGYVAEPAEASLHLPADQPYARVHIPIRFLDRGG